MAPRTAAVAEHQLLRPLYGREHHGDGLQRDARAVRGHIQRLGQQYQRQLVPREEQHFGSDSGVAVDLDIGTDAEDPSGCGSTIHRMLLSRRLKSCSDANQSESFNKSVGEVNSQALSECGNPGESNDGHPSNYKAPKPLIVPERRKCHLFLRHGATLALCSHCLHVRADRFDIVLQLSGAGCVKRHMLQQQLVVQPVAGVSAQPPSGS